MVARSRRKRAEARWRQRYTASQPKPKRSPKRRLVHAIRVTTALLATGLILAGVAWTGLTHTVQNVEIRGLASDRTALGESLADRVGSEFGGTNLFLLDTTEVTEKLSQEFRVELASTTVQRGWASRSLIVSVELREPALNWSTRGAAYVLDQEGVVISHEAEANLLLVQDRSNLPIEIGQKIVPSDFVTFVNTVVRLLPKSAGLTPTALSVRDTTSELFVNVGRGFFVRFDTTHSAESQIENVVAILKQARVVNDYIDVRIPHKAYYR